VSRLQVLSDEMWAQIEPLMPVASTKGGRPFRDHRTVVEAIIWRYRTGSPWRDLPEQFGAWKTAWRRHDTYSKDGTWDAILAAVLTEAADADRLGGQRGLDGQSGASTRHEPRAGHRGIRRITRIWPSSLLTTALAVPAVG
jgi:transposase